MRRVIIGCDHAGVDFKHKISTFLEKYWGCEVEDIGTESKERVDYPDIVRAACGRFLGEKFDLGILLCGSGIGMSIAANRYEGIRCALVNSVGLSILAKKHNGANFLAFGCKNQKISKILGWLIQYNNSNFLEGRYLDRIKKIENLLIRI